MHGSFRSPQVRPANWSNHVLLARDLKLLQTLDYKRLSGEAVEVKRMLASFMQRLRAVS